MFEKEQLGKTLDDFVGEEEEKNMNNNIHDFHIPSFQWVQGFLDKIGLGCLPDLPWINMLSKPGGVNRHPIFRS